MISIDQLLESVDLDFEPRFVTKDENGVITIFAHKPVIEVDYGRWSIMEWGSKYFGPIRLSEFSDKDWQECIYEVPRKTTGKIEKLERHIRVENGYEISCPPDESEIICKINELVNYVNALIESNNIHEKQIDKLQMKLEPEKCAVNELKGANQ